MKRSIVTFSDCTVFTFNLAIVENKHEMVIAEFLTNTDYFIRKKTLKLQCHVNGFFGLQVEQINDQSFD